MYAKLYRNHLFPFYETVLRKRNTLKYLDELEKNQWLSEDELLSIQWRKLKKLLDHSYNNVPYYRKKFDESGLKPDDIKSADDYSKLPVLAREDIRNNRNDLIARNHSRQQLLSKTTSGSTGVPLDFAYDRDTYEWHIASASRSDRWAGWDFGERELYIWGRPPYKIALRQVIKTKLHHLFLRRKVINTFTLNANTLKNTVEEINRFNPAVIIGYATAVYNLARFIRASRMECVSPRGIICSAEKLYPFQRQAIEQAFAAKVYDRYGCQEVMLIACECDEHNGLHINIDNLFVETVKNGVNTKCGESGEVVLTDLNNYSMPFLRYRNQDMAILSDRKCPCGRGLPLMEKVDGRTIDAIVTEDGRIISGEVFLYIFDRFEWVRKYQAVQEKIGELVVNIVKVEGADVEKDLMVARGEMKKVLGDKVKAEICFVDEIPLTKSGKSKIVMSHVPVELGNGR